MNLFERSSDWIKIHTNKRICLTYQIDSNEKALQACFNKDNSSIFEFNFLLDINRSFNESLYSQIQSENREIFIYRPENFNNLFSAIDEISNFCKFENQKNINVILNDWDAIKYLFHNSFSDFTLNQLLIKLKFLSDYSNIYMLSLINSTGFEILKSWSDLIINTNQNIYADLDETRQVDKAVEEMYQSVVYELNKSNNSEDLLSIRRKIKILSQNLNNQQKVNLNNLYKVQLQRIKSSENIFEEAF